MGNLTIYREESAAFTAVSNYFIDSYMTEANDAQLKVYLYLLRVFQANRSTSVSDMADLFNHTEKDILRALRYWEKKGLLALDYDDSKGLSSIRLLTPEDEGAAAQLPRGADIVQLPSGRHTPPQSQQIQAQISQLQQTQSQQTQAQFIQPQQTQAQLPEKPSYSLDDLKAFRNNEETAQLLFIAEQYIGRPLKPSEMKTILFIYDRLGFSSDMTDYLIQYCVGRGKRDFRYIEKVALSWAEDHITTPGQAKALAGKYDKTVYAVMKALGKTSAPTPKEVSYIIHWTKELGFTLPIVEEACERTVMATDKHRFEYADGILTSWHKNHIQSLDDIRAADAAYQKSRPAQTRSSAAGNQFNQFPQREYDFDALEKELLSN